MNSNIRKSRISRGFTLVEILIVVIILGILAAIIIPQFSNASQGARVSSLTSQLQTVRSQIELYRVQHGDDLPTGLGTGTDDWGLMTVKTDADQTVNATGAFGPYLTAAPVNPLNGFTTVATTALDFANGAANPDSGGTDIGWVINTTTGKIWATTANGALVFNEETPSSTVNTDD